jgi:hypothetical protein
MSQIITTTFMDARVKIIDMDGKKWLTAEQLGLCLGYNEANARQGIGKIYERHADEFTEADTFVVNLTTNSRGNPNVRIFSETGAVKCSFFANTPRAKEFRAWAARELAGGGITPMAEAAPLADAGSQAVLSGMMRSMDSMAQSVDKLARGLDVVQRQLNVTGKYISLLEVNQKGHLKVTREIEAEVLRLTAEGMPQASIARNLRISPSTVCQLIKGKYLFSKRIDEPTVEQAIQAMMNGKLEAERLRLLENIASPA